jgi:hypothetical protein
MAPTASSRASRFCGQESRSTRAGLAWVMKLMIEQLVRPG